MTAIPITGFAVCNALGTTNAAVSEALIAGRTGLAPRPLPVPFATAVGAVDAELPELPEALRSFSTRTARLAQLLVTQLEPVLAALRGRVAPERIAVILGSSTAGADVTEHAYRHYLKTGALPAGYDLFRQHTYGALLHVVSELTGARGPMWVVSTACTASAKPLASAARLLATGLADAAIVGGIDALCEMTLRGFYSLESLAPAPCRPFSSLRDGISIGEGGALLVLERGGDALALLEAVGESSDAYHLSAPHPEGLGARAAMQHALRDAGIEPGAVDHINAHGTGTRLNDIAEAKAITSLFGDGVPVVSTKGYTGHMLGGAGACEAALALLGMQAGFIPASIGADPVDPAITLELPRTTRRARLRRVLSNSLAFGGNNVSVLLRAV